MTNKTQKNLEKLLSILGEGNVKKRKAPYIIGFAVLIAVSLFIGLRKVENIRSEKYFISRGSAFNLVDIRKAKAQKTDLTKLGEDGNHIIYHLSQDTISVYILQLLQENGFKLNTLNDLGENPLEQILLYRNYDFHTTKLTNKLDMNNFSQVEGNFKVLIDLKILASDDVIRRVSKKCEKQDPMTCLKAAFYFKANGKLEHAKSYAKRTCYKPINEKLCKIAKSIF